MAFWQSRLVTRKAEEFCNELFCPPEKNENAPHKEQGLRAIAKDASGIERCKWITWQKKASPREEKKKAMKSLIVGLTLAAFSFGAIPQQIESGAGGPATGDGGAPPQAPVSSKKTIVKITGAVVVAAIIAGAASSSTTTHH